MADRTYSSPADVSRKAFSDDEMQKVWDKAKKLDGEDLCIEKIMQALGLNEMNMVKLTLHLDGR